MIKRNNIFVSKTDSIQGTFCTPLQQDLVNISKHVHPAAAAAAAFVGAVDVWQRSRHLAAHAAGHRSRQALVCRHNNSKAAAAGRRQQME
jgi:hypothetical protein